MLGNVKGGRSRYFCMKSYSLWQGEGVQYPKKYEKSWKKIVEILAILKIPYKNVYCLPPKVSTESGFLAHLEISQ